MSRARTAALLVSAVALATAGCGGDGDDTAADPETAPAATETVEADGGVQQGDAQAGEIVFVNEGCGGCHTLADAGVIGNIDEEGSIGPNLDEAMPSYDAVVEVVTNGRGAMPSFAGDISAQDIQDVAAYVSSVAGA